MFKKTALVCALTTAAISTTAVAAPHYEISPNRVSKIAKVYIHDYRACRAGSTPHISIVNPPRHGKVLVRWAHGKNARDCDGTAGVIVSFKPDRNFRGEDYFIARFKTKPSAHANRLQYSEAFGFSICVE